MKSNELWAPVLDFEENYEVSNQGNVRSIRTGNLLRPASNGFGYLVVMLQKDWGKPTAKKKTARVHRIVLQSFTGERNDHLQVAHLDGDTKNNKLSNLRWSTRADNEADKHKHGTKQGRIGEPQKKLTDDDVREIVALSRKGVSTLELSKRFGISHGNITHIRAGRTWKHITRATIKSEPSEFGKSLAKKFFEPEDEERKGDE